MGAGVCGSGSGARGRSSSSSPSSETKRPDYRARQKGTWEYTAAAVNGMIVGKAIQNADGGVGSSKSVSVETWR